MQGTLQKDQPVTFAIPTMEQLHHQNHLAWVDCITHKDFLEETQTPVLLVAVRDLHKDPEDPAVEVEEVMGHQDTKMC